MPMDKDRGKNTRPKEVRDGDLKIVSFQGLGKLLDRLCTGKTGPHAAKDAWADLLLEKCESFFESSPSSDLLQLPDKLAFRLIVFYIFSLGTPEAFEHSYFAQKYNVVNFILSNAELLYLSRDVETLLSHFLRCQRVEGMPEAHSGEESGKRMLGSPEVLRTTRERYVSVLVSLAPHCIIEDLIYNLLYPVMVETVPIPVMRDNELAEQCGTFILWNAPQATIEWLYCLVRHKCLRRTTLRYIFDRVVYFDAADCPCRFLLLSEIICSYAELDKLGARSRTEKAIREALGILKGSGMARDKLRRLEDIGSDGLCPQPFSPEEGSVGEINTSGSTAALEAKVGNHIAMLEQQLKDLTPLSLGRYCSADLQSYYVGSTDMHQDNVFVLVSSIWEELVFYLRDIGMCRGSGIEQSIIDLLITMIEHTGDFLRLRVAENQASLQQPEIDMCKLVNAITRNFKKLNVFANTITLCLRRCLNQPGCGDIKFSLSEQTSNSLGLASPDSDEG